MNYKILVCCHKPLEFFPSYDYYLPIHVGKALSGNDLGVVGDDSGDNISSKNKTFCELTGMYWAWKNLKDTDIVGLCHYRRFFDFHQQVKSGFPHTSFPVELFNSLDTSIPEAVFTNVSHGKIIVAKPLHYRYPLMEVYCTHHYSDDFRTLQCVIRETQPPKVIDAFFKSILQSNRFHHYNMFIMRWRDFDEYCSWIFPILFNIESKINISNYSVEQKRIFGFMAEYLFNTWLELHKERTIETPVIWLNDGHDNLQYYSRARYFLRTLTNDIATSLIKPVYNNMI